MTTTMLLEHPIPVPLRGTEPDSFAYITITERLPRIGRRVLAENAFAADVEERLRALLDELPLAEIRTLHDAAAPDAAAWAHYVTPHLEQNWLEVPWFFAETYFYRRILEATGYFQEGAGYYVDPFAPHKEQSLQGSRQQVRGLAQRVEQWREEPDRREVLRQALAVALWGNQGDLSMWPGGGEEMPSHDEDAAQAHVLVDDRDAAVVHLDSQESKGIRIDIIEDNAGFELIGDLALVDVLLASNWAASVVLDVKFHPTFVSDAVPRDVHDTIRYLAVADDEAVRAWGGRLQGYADDGRLALRQHPFWTSPLEGWKMPSDLRQTLAEAALVISKGDANYRRLLGDRHWTYTTPFAQVVSYFPAPLLALRTVKSNVAAGLDAMRVRELNEHDGRWVVSGEWGVMQFAP